MSRAKLTIIVLVAVATLSGNAFAQSTSYVDANATGPTHDGYSWCGAFLEVHRALDLADPGTVIRVANGTYLPDTNGLDDPREGTFQMSNGVTLEGGYAGCGAADPNERNIGLHETIISGDIGVPSDPDDNSYHVVTGSDTDATAMFDGFTITAGNANGNDWYAMGGGMMNYDGSPTVTNRVFSGNSAHHDGGGMYNREYSSPTVTNRTFRGNSSGRAGGGMSNNNVCSPILVNCIFKWKLGVQLRRRSVRLEF